MLHNHSFINKYGIQISQKKQVLDSPQMYWTRSIYPQGRVVDMCTSRFLTIYVVQTNHLSGDVGVIL